MVERESLLEAARLNYGSGGGEEDKKEEEKSTFSDFNIRRLELMDTDAMRVSELVDQASWFVEEAYLGVSRPHPESSLFARKLYRFHADLHYVRGIAIFTLVALSFFEVPLWCRNSNAKFPCGGDPEEVGVGNIPPTYRWYLLDRTQSMIVEEVCLFFLLFNIALTRLFLGRNFLKRKDRLVLLILVLFSIGDTFITSLSPMGDFNSRFRASPYLRILIFITANRNARRTLRQIAILLVNVQNIMSLIVMFLLFFAWTGTILFRDTREGDEQFSNLYESAFHLLILLTTANFPDIMMPNYSSNRITFVFFFIFLCVGLFFLLNAILAILYSHFVTLTQKERAKSECTTKKKLNIAFDLMLIVEDKQALIHGSDTIESKISLESCILLFHELNHFKHITFMEADRMSEIFVQLDKDCSSRLDREEFSDLCIILNQSIKKRNVKTDIERWFPKLFKNITFQKFSKAVSSTWFDVVIDVILIINGLIIYIESSPILNGGSIGSAGSSSVDDAATVTSWEGIETLFSCLYFVEMSCKIVVHGFSNYWQSTKNRFDCIITLLCFIIDIYAYIPNGFSSHTIVKYLLLARLLRLFRLLMNVEYYRSIFAAWIKLIPVGSNLFVMMFCVMYFYSVMGIQLFGGLIYPNNSVLNGSTFAQSNYFANNFNDMCGGMVTLFELLVVNNWHVIAEGPVLVTSKYARWFFISFYVIGVVIFLNLVLAHVLDAFHEEMHKSGVDSIDIPVDSSSDICTESANDDPNTTPAPRNLRRRRESSFIFEELLLNDEKKL